MAPSQWWAGRAGPAHRELLDAQFPRGGPRTPDEHSRTPGTAISRALAHHEAVDPAPHRAPHRFAGTPPHPCLAAQAATSTRTTAVWAVFRHRSLHATACHGASTARPTGHGFQRLHVVQAMRCAIGSVFSYFGPKDCIVCPSMDALPPAAARRTACCSASPPAGAAGAGPVARSF
ncbi:hypothetical protein FQR65_LT20612 [Abscondita terminalis]|nr:hypothetical protein FQR65_LT20612 [Abscondita terminalis]